jgi:hypothetical protein
MMKKIELNSWLLILIFAIAGVGIYLLENTVRPDQSGSLLQTLLFWVALAQGSVALVAVSDLSKGKWIRSMKRELLSVFPMIMLIAALSLILFKQINMYHWSHENYNAWLEQWFFVMRNFVLLTISFLLAWKFAIESLKESESKNLWAALYILSFVSSQSLLGFDWVMSLEYPWISTLFGGFFFIESMYSGIAVGIIILLFKRKDVVEGDHHGHSSISKDLTNFLFGFSLFWAGMFFAQFLTIWYGNLPEEVVFISKRLDHPVVRELGILSLLCLFFIPFISLLSRKVKASPLLAAVVALIVMAGLFIERLVYLMPVVNMRFDILAIEMVVLAILFILATMSRDKILN